VSLGGCVEGEGGTDFLKWLFRRPGTLGFCEVLSGNEGGLCEGSERFTGDDFHADEAGLWGGVVYTKGGLNVRR
jgi:hypothetical protein